MRIRSASNRSSSVIFTVFTWVAIKNVAYARKGQVVPTEIVYQTSTKRNNRTSVLFMVFGGVRIFLLQINRKNAAGGAARFVPGGDIDLERRAAGDRLLLRSQGVDEFI